MSFNGLQKAIYDTLKDNAAFAAEIPEDRIYDKMPLADQRDDSPFCVIGESDWIEDSADCVDAYDEDVNLHIWTRDKGGFKEVKRIAGLAITALNAVSGTLEPDEGKLAGWYCSGGRFMRDPDGISLHAVITLEALMEN